MAIVNGTLNSTQLNTLVDQPVLMFKAFAIIFVLIIIVGAIYTMYQLLNK